MVYLICSWFVYMLYTVFFFSFYVICLLWFLSLLCDILVMVMVSHILGKNVERTGVITGGFPYFNVVLMSLYKYFSSVQTNFVYNGWSMIFGCMMSGVKDCLYDLMRSFHPFAHTSWIQKVCLSFFSKCVTMRHIFQRFDGFWRFLTITPVSIFCVFCF